MSDPLETMLTKWAGCVDRLIDTAPIRAVVEEVGLPETGHSTPPERQAIRREAHRVVDGWLTRDLATLDATRAAERTLDVAECECVPGHRCDCHDLRSLLHRILTSAEYGKMEAEGLAAAALGLRWSEADDRYVSRAALRATDVPSDRVDRFGRPRIGPRRPPRAATPDDGSGS